MSARFPRFENWSTGTKLLLLMSAALLPLGLALAWTARTGIQESEKMLADVARGQALSGARAIDSLIARNALALRVAANGAVRSGGDPCREISTSLALTPGVAQIFKFRDSNESLVCAKGDVRLTPLGPVIAPGAIELWASRADNALFYRVGVIGGMATGRLTSEELAAAVRDVDSGVRGLWIRDSRGERLELFESPEPSDEERYFRSSFPIADGRLEVTGLTATPRIEWRERLTVMLPVLMFIVAALGSLMLVQMLLTRPLSRLQRAVNEYRPGESLVLPARLGSAEEIRSLGASFERAVDRIEDSEHQMVEALEGQRRLVREVHHRVKNNLQVIASMLNIHGRSAATPESRDAYAAIGRRVDALSVVHRTHFAEV